MHGSRLPAGKAVRAIPVPVRLHLCAADQGAGDARAEELGQYQARPDHAAEHLLESRRARRLQKSVLEVRARTAASRRYRGPDRPGDDRTSSDHVRARRIGRSAERIELFDPAARGLGPCRVKAHENAGAAVPLARSLAGADAGACRARPLRREHADRRTACLHARPRACARCRSHRFRCAASGCRIGRSRPAGRRGFQPGAEPARLSAPSRSRTHAGCGFGGARWKSKAAARARL